jgi:1-acyl-sn-glycerol-3-phosphate acyltransferase
MPMLAQTPKLIVLTADWVWNNPVYRYTIRNAEYLPASRGVEAIMPQLKSLVERGYHIAVYPEGTRSKNCDIGRFHKGAFHIAEELNLDIIPMGLYGSGKALPKHGRILRRWPMHLEICKRISSKEFKSFGDTLMARTSYMRQYYKQEYAKLANRIEQNV